MSPGRSIEKMRVLVVEDEPYMAEAIRDGEEAETGSKHLADDERDDADDAGAESSRPGRCRGAPSGDRRFFARGGPRRSTVRARWTRTGFVATQPTRLCPYARDAPTSVQWWRGLDLNQRPLGYETDTLRSTRSELCQRVAFRAYLAAPSQVALL